MITASEARKNVENCIAQTQLEIVNEATAWVEKVSKLIEAESLSNRDSVCVHCADIYGVALLKAEEILKENGFAVTYIGSTHSLNISW